MILKYPTLLMNFLRKWKKRKKDMSKLLRIVKKPFIKYQKYRTQNILSEHPLSQ